MSEGVQVRNDQLVNLLSADFQLRNGPSFAWKTVVSALLALPGLRACWPMSPVDYQQPECTDISGHGYDLQAAAALGNVTFGFDPTPSLSPVSIYGGGANQYLSRADGGAGNWADILGTETYITAAQRGLTLGGWFWFAALPGAINVLMGKNDGVNQSYELFVNAADLLRLRVWAGPIAISSAATINAGWNHCVGLYDQATQDLHVVLNGVVTTNAGAAPAALPDTTAPFTIGANGAGGSLLTGRASMCFLCAQYIGTLRAQSLYYHQKGMFGL